MSKEHTPTPWHSDDYVIYGHNGEHIAHTDNTMRSPDEDDANAAHIVKCVNMHDELVGALKRAHEEWCELYAERYNELPTETPYGETLKKAGAL